jgi:hypothetical protein
MYQIVINTPQGELGTMPMTKETADAALLGLGEFNDISFDLEDGQTKVYISKDMIGRSVFFIKKVS